MWLASTRSSRTAGSSLESVMTLVHSAPLKDCAGFSIDQHDNSTTACKHTQFGLRNNMPNFPVAGSSKRLDLVHQLIPKDWSQNNLGNCDRGCLIGYIRLSVHHRRGLDRQYS